ncbi:MAG: hypothetical protein ACOY5Y_10870 [Pseudomonadota bacterium]
MPDRRHRRANLRAGDTQSRWVETVEPGAPRPGHPAPSVTLTPSASPESGHDHHR